MVALSLMFWPPAPFSRSETDTLSRLNKLIYGEGRGDEIFFLLMKNDLISETNFHGVLGWGVYIPLAT